MAPLRLDVVFCSTRPGRAGLPIGRWLFERAKAHGAFEVEWVDLAEVGLPVFDEPQHPRLKQYQHEHTKRWSATVAAADAFVFVTPEYNYYAAPALVNAVDFLSSEWAYKPAGFVSYGGQSGGLRAVQAVKPLLTSVKVMPIPEAVALPFFIQQLNKETGAFTASEAQQKSADAMLLELARWAGALKPLRS